MLARLHKAMEEKEEGFTLIELLVVIIIIGILAAIAIPVFLNQRNKGYDAAAKSDLVNMATAEETYLTDYSAYSSFTATVGPATLIAEGFNKSSNVDAWTATAVGNQSYTLTDCSASNTLWTYTSGTGTGGNITKTAAGCTY